MKETELGFTPVIFRKYRDGDIIALFPADPGTDDAYTCSSYMHTGGHGSADPMAVIRTTTIAMPNEYADLRKELESYPYNYNLKTFHRLSRGFLQLRKERLHQ